MTEDSNSVEQCVRLSATTTTEDSSQILPTKVGVEEPPAFSLFQQFTVELRTHFSFLCSTESAEVEQIVEWKSARCDEMLSTEFCKVSYFKQQTALLWISLSATIMEGRKDRPSIAKAPHIQLRQNVNI
jgi:hypothetical protein